MEEGERVEAQGLASLRIGISGQCFDAQVSNEIYRQKIPAPSSPLLKKGAAKVIRCPMPGIVAAVRVKKGDMVTKGDGLLVVEAMKMENEIKAPYNGIIKQVNVTKGSMVKLNDELIVMG